jgi:hypothetical protein
MGTNGKLEHTYICWKIKNIQNENRKFIYLKNSFILGFAVTGISCEREFRMKLSSQLFKLSEVFIDGFTGGLNYSFEGSYFQALLLIKKQNTRGFSYAI